MASFSLYICKDNFLGYGLDSFTLAILVFRILAVTSKVFMGIVELDKRASIAIEVKCVFDSIDTNATDTIL